MKLLAVLAALIGAGWYMNRRLEKLMQELIA